VEEHSESLSLLLLLLLLLLTLLSLSSLVELIVMRELTELPLRCRCRARPCRLAGDFTSVDARRRAVADTGELERERERFRLECCVC
jgi:hypothetical protein